MLTRAVAILVLTIVALPAIDCKGENATAEAEQVRQDFLEKYATSASFAYLNRVATEARKNKRVQHKRPHVHDSLDVQKRVKDLEANGVNATAEPVSILAQNEPLAAFLYQDLKQRRAGQTITMSNGMQIELQKWPRDQSICYSFEDGADPFTQHVAREAFRFWTENSCLTWEENCLNRPVIKISTAATDSKGKAKGCFTTPGRSFKEARVVRGRLVPKFNDEQPMSLAAPGCTWFDTAAHEASHVMGMFHEQARPDRRQYVDIVWENIDEDWKKQYERESTSKTLGIPYDYASNMHYTGYNNNPKIDMLSKKPIYQHTMGNKVGPIFSDIKFVNMYNDCMCKSGATCANEGFPHPRDCSKCVCPEGFGGRTCTERQQGSGGAPASCGQTIYANPTWQTAKVGVPAPVGVGPYNDPEDKKITVHAACCHWWIKGNGKRVELAFDSVEPGSIYECQNSCGLGGTEVKFEDLTTGGARVCCPNQGKEFGTVVSASDLVIVRVCSLRNTQSAVVRFRTTDLPYAAGGGPRKNPHTEECRDQAAFCHLVSAHPHTCQIAEVAVDCRKSCGLC